ncbi:uncharacterized protein BO95DRAFT_47045 [Aspergillus brunneoviolaceus CBS 621.78]|uniref:Uncharacterized protein n=1 Tax=Aspergillus brunneoviolaceus CBS 621.78 TaxID=1450534 RepID=A0ACD1FRM1_9EURO|nr:hypothetical protein BO95DRAFT_47045 [Aspergillus brunneoviolaceus CBS 621.78]RAH39615.1 hypothetical protein BO95DRAFT_47045 [Aspergillus brunneoviolaceus CBS 621.78]
MVIYRYGHGPRDKRFRLKSSLVFRILRHYDRDQELICPGALPTVPVVCLCLCLPGTKKGGVEDIHHHKHKLQKAPLLERKALRREFLSIVSQKRKVSSTLTSVE